MREIALKHENICLVEVMIKIRLADGIEAKHRLLVIIWIVAASSGQAWGPPGTPSGLRTSFLAAFRLNLHQTIRLEDCVVLGNVLATQFIHTVNLSLVIIKVDLKTSKWIQGSIFFFHFDIWKTLWLLIFVIICIY